MNPTNYVTLDSYNELLKTRDYWKSCWQSTTHRVDTEIARSRDLRSKVDAQRKELTQVNVTNRKRKQEQLAAAFDLNPSKFS